MLRIGKQIRFRLAAILLLHWREFVSQHRKWIRPVVFETVRKIIACRTPALGCHLCGATQRIPLRRIHFFERFHELTEGQVVLIRCPECGQGLQIPGSYRSHTGESVVFDPENHPRKAVIHDDYCSGPMPDRKTGVRGTIWGPLPLGPFVP